MHANRDRFSLRAANTDRYMTDRFSLCMLSRKMRLISSESRPSTSCPTDPTDVRTLYRIVRHYTCTVDKHTPGSAQARLMNNLGLRLVLIVIASSHHNVELSS